LRKTESAIYLLLVAISCTGLGYLLAYPDPEIITKIQVIEIPQLITQTITKIETIEIPVTEIVTVNHTEIHYVEQLTPIPLRDFPDQETLETWILNDPTDTYTYSESRWTCMDYTMRVTKNAEKLGYRVTFMFRETEQHAVAMAYCEAEALYYVWEPQSDKMLWVWQSTESG